ncbi:Insulinase family protein [Perilla frutescens var. frutescens]|nr:Insulinase family protein [Perilla frutescens var. frutescens]
MNASFLGNPVRDKDWVLAQSPTLRNSNRVQSTFRESEGEAYSSPSLYRQRQTMSRLLSTSNGTICKQEHMLFMGSTDFPDENEYDSYLSKHGGSSNAYTETEHTCYHFEVKREFLNGALTRALSIFNATLGRKGKKHPTWKVIKASLQPDSKQCGYFIMRYMKEIIEELKLSGSISIRSHRKYSKEKIDEVRVEWANCVLDHI